MRKSEKNNTPDSVKNFINGVYTKEEAQKVLDLIKANENFATLDDYMSKAWEESKDDNVLDNYEQEAATFLKELRKQEKHRRSKYLPIRKYVAVAASIAALIIVSFGGYKYLNHVAGQQQIAYTEASTSFGERKTLTLPDGTTVNLNACSKIKYPIRFSGDKRTIQLEGEAFFDVIENDEQPFVVNTHKFDVTVLGTEFDVKAYKEDKALMVSVASGKVQIDMSEAMARLTANEYLILNSETDEYQKVVDQQSVAVWHIGELRFDRTPIKEVAKELGRVYNYTFIFDSDTSFDNVITGRHNNKSLEDVLSAIEHTSGIKSRISGNTVVFYK